jgi:hypothetical protein
MKFRPPEPPPPAPAAPKLYERPDDQILLHGEMIKDTETIGKLLQGLPFAGSGYRGNLRVIISAATRINTACIELLGEAPPAPSTIVDDEEDPSNLIDEPPAVGMNNYPAPKRRKYQRRAAPPEPTRRINEETRKPEPATNNGGTARKLGEETTGRKSDILARLRKQAQSSADLIKGLPGKPSSGAVYTALSALRAEGLIDSRIDPLDGQRKNFLTN